MKFIATFSGGGSGGTAAPRGGGRVPRGRGVSTGSLREKIRKAGSAILYENISPKAAARRYGLSVKVQRIRGGGQFVQFGPDRKGQLRYDRRAQTALARRRVSARGSGFVKYSTIR